MTKAESMTSDNLCFVVVGLFVLVMIIDLFPRVQDWLNRRGMRGYSDKYQWSGSIVDRGIRWLGSTPRVRVTDNTRLIALDMLRGNYSRNCVQHWQQASLILGLAEFEMCNQDKRIKGQIVKFLDTTFDHAGNWRRRPEQIDVAMLGYAVMMTSFVDGDRFLGSFDYIWKMIKTHAGEDGTICYRTSMKNYRHVDTIGLACPFLVSYGVKYCREECIELAVRQILEYEKYGMLQPQHIPCHAYRYEDKFPLGIYGWGRGVGWYALGLVDSWNGLPAHHRHKSVLGEKVALLARAAMAHQQDKGNWNWTIARRECAPDSSATAALAWFMLNAAQIEAISKECVISANSAIRYLMKVTRRNGAIDFSQGDTKDIGVYSRLFNVLPFTQGLAIRCLSRIQESS